MSTEITVIPTPIPFRPGSVNAFRIPYGGDRWMLVDGGVDTEDGWEALDQGVRESGGWSGLALHFLTHMHLDHIGLAERVQSLANVPILISRTDGERMLSAAADPADEQQYRSDLFRSAGIPERMIRDVESLTRSGQRLAPAVCPTRLIEAAETEIPEIPGWRIVPTPGHTAGHFGLFRPTDGLLIAGDAVLPTISPTIGVSRQSPDPVGEYLAALDQLLALGPRTVWGGHGDRMAGTSRISELRSELLAENQRVLEVVRAGQGTAWDISGRRYAGRDLPPGPRYQAMRETLAHLQNLQKRGELTSKREGGVTLFHLSERSSREQTHD